MAAGVEARVAARHHQREGPVVDQRVAGGGHRRQQGEAERRGQVGRGPQRPGARQGQAERADHDQPHAGEVQGRQGAAAQHAHRHQRHQHHRQGAGDGIEHADLAPGIGPGQAAQVEHLAEPRGGEPAPERRRQPRRRRPQPQQRRQRQRPAPHRQHEEGQRRRAPLAHQVPAGMQAHRQQHEPQRRGTHDAHRPDGTTRSHGHQQGRITLSLQKGSCPGRGRGSIDIGDDRRRQLGRRGARLNARALRPGRGALA